MPTDSPLAPPYHRLGPSPDLIDEILAGLPGAAQADPDVHIDLTEAARLLPPNRPGKAVHVSALHRARNPGTAARAPGREGQRITLRCVRRPGGWMTTRRALAEWLAELTADCNGQPAEPIAPRALSTRRQREIAAADRQLAAAGFDR